MKLYRACTPVPSAYILHEGFGEPSGTERIDAKGNTTRKPPFPGVTPKGKVPTLMRNDHTLPTEFSAIAIWLARTDPEKGLLPSNPEGEARAMEAMAYAEGAIHGQGFRRMVMPERFEPQDIVQQAVGLGRCSAKRIMLHVAEGNR